MSPRYRKYKLPDNLTFDKSLNGFRYRNPVTKERRWLGSDKDVAIRKAKKLNLAIQILLDKHQVDAGNPYCVRNIINLFKATMLPYKPWAESYRYTFEKRIDIISEELGKMHFVALDRLVIADFLTKRADGKPDLYNKWRRVFIELCKFAIAKKIVNYNEAEATLQLSTSKKLECNQKVRQALTIEHYKKIVKAAEPCLNLAMRLSLITLLSRNEIANLEFKHIRDNKIFVIRKKVANRSDWGFIKIAITPELQEIIDESKADLRRRSVLCPYVIHRSPERENLRHDRGKPHRMYVTPNYLTRAFKRTLLQCYPEFEKAGPKCPSYNELRNLGSKLYEDAGYSLKNYIRPLMAHSDEKTTEIYTSGRELSDEHFHEVHADLSIKQLLK